MHETWTECQVESRFRQHLKYSFCGSVKEGEGAGGGDQEALKEVEREVRARAEKFFGSVQEKRRAGGKE